MQKSPPRSLSHALMTGLDGEPSPDTPWTHSRRGAAQRSRRPGKEERRRLMLPAIPVSSHARTVPGPASLGSDSTATSVPVADGSDGEERHHRFRWTSTTVSYGSSGKEELPALRRVLSPASNVDVHSCNATRTVLSVLSHTAQPQRPPSVNYLRHSADLPLSSVYPELSLFCFQTYFDAIHHWPSIFGFLWLLQ